MPELPEVETVKNELAPYVIGHRITDITLNWEGIVKEPHPSKFCSRLVGQKITSLARRGKYLLFSLDGDGVLVIHLKMTGSLLLAPTSAELGRFIRAVIHLDGGVTIHFRDPRKFGVMRLVQDPGPVVKRLGPEPLEDDFTPKLLAKHLQNRQASIKAILNDQTAVAGLGNMYADETLFSARLHPQRAGSSLSSEEVKRLHQSIREVLSAAINNKGASINTYFRPSGEKGTAHFEFKVAHQGGKPCPRCGTPIERIKVRNRGTYFCPNCQRLEA